MADSPNKRDLGIAAIRRANRLLRRTPVEVVWYSDFDTELKREMSSELADVEFRELLTMQTVAMPGQITIEEARFLGELVGRTDPADPIVEIGTLFGSSSRVLTLFKPASQPLITVDNFSWNPLEISPRIHEHAARRALAEATDKYHVTVINKEKQDFFDTYDAGTPAMVFLDADHSYEATLADINWARSVGTGIISGHDYGTDDRVTKAVDESGGPAELVGSVFVLQG